MTATTTANPVARRLVALVAAALLVLSLGAVPAQAQTQEGLVNVNVSDVTVQLPITIAANICDVNVNVLTEQLRDGGAECDADADSDAVFGPEVEDGEAPTQEGLVNVNVSDVIIQVPVAVAANICDVNVNVLARQFRDGGAECDADAESIATT
jgi:hypothetical protein